MYDSTIPKRLRARREANGLAGYQLAKMAGISPSYYSLIESGQKLPSVEVAIRLAKALGDDEELYRGWVEIADDQDLDARAARLSKIREAQTELGNVLHRRGRAGMQARRIVEEELDDGAAFDLMPLDATQGIVESPSKPWYSRVFAGKRESAQPAASPAGPTVTVPVLSEGTEPGDAGQTQGSIEDLVCVDRRLLPDEHGELFAYRASEDTTAHVRGLVIPGDLLVFAPNPEAIDPTAIYAVRKRGRIVFSRIAYSQPKLILLSSDPYGSPVELDVGDEDGLFRHLVGVVVTGIRTWTLPERREPRKAQASLGRTGRLDDGHIVRDCEWKDNYGWRPVQRPEDMDYLDDHPGTTVRFRLMREGRVKFVLEMDPDQWREGLGSYFHGPTWRRNGYIVAITKRREGEYTEEFQERWAGYIREPRSQES